MIVLSRTEFMDLKRPCVYWFLDQNKIPLYIGASEQGLERVFKREKSARNTPAGRYTALQKFAFVRVVFFASRQEAFAYEEAEIHRWHPGSQKCCVCNKIQMTQKTAKNHDKGITPN